MASQIDNLTLLDGTTGLIRSIDTDNDDLVISVDLTLQSGAKLVADNIKRGVGDPNGSVTGILGDLFQRLDGGGQHYISGGGTVWNQVQTGTVGLSPLTDVLSAGNTTSGEDIIISSGDVLRSEDASAGNAQSLSIRAGNSTAVFGGGGNLTITAGAGGPGGPGGDLVLATAFPSGGEPGDIHLNSFGAVLVNPAADSQVLLQGSAVISIDERSNLVGVPSVTASTAQVWLRDDNPNNLILTDGTATDRLIVAHPGNPVQGDVLYHNGTYWSRLPAGTAGQTLTTQGSGSNPSWSGSKRYPNSASNPVSPVPSAGDAYYNTSLEMEMRYDGGRGKWLSVEAVTFPFGRNGGTAAGSYYRGVNGVVWSATTGHIAFHDGTVVEIGYTRAGSASTTFDIVANGSSLATLASSSTSGKSIALNADFSEDDILAVLNQAGGNDTNDVQGWVKVKWRV